MSRAIQRIVPAVNAAGVRRTKNINIDCPYGDDVFVTATREEIVDGIHTDVTPVRRKLSESPDNITITLTDGTELNARQIGEACARMVDRWEELLENP